MAYLDVAQLLDSLRQHGTIDSQGQFTISLAEARRKLTQFRSSNRRRYLLQMVSSGIGAGATRVVVAREPGGYRLGMPGAYFPESELLGSFSRSLADSESATDLVLGLQAAFAEGAEAVQVTISHPREASYLWDLRAATESSRPARPGEKSMEIKVAFPRSLGERVRGFFGLRGYAGQPEELRILEQMCDHSRIPILIGDETLNRPAFFAKQSVVGKIGEFDMQVAGGCHVWPLPARDWTGLLAPGSGSVILVVCGVNLGQVLDCGLQGVVHHDGLARDLTREGLLQDERYERLLKELEEVRLTLLEQSMQHIQTLPPVTVAELLGSAAAAFFQEQLSRPAGEKLVRWLAARHGTADLGSAAPCDQLVTLLRRIASTGDCPDLPPVERILLEACAWAMEHQGRETPQLFETTKRELERAQPGETLMPGYLLLGLGAFFSAQGQESVAQQHWMEALDVVRAGHDDKAESLIHAHMDFPVEHIMSQTSQAIAIFLRTTATAEAL